MIKSFSHIYRRINQHRHYSATEMRNRRFIHRLTPVLSYIQSAIRILAIIASVFCLVELTLYFGFERTASEATSLKQLFRIPQAIFILNILINLILNLKPAVHNTKILKWIVDGAIMLSILPWAYPHPEHPWIPILERVLYSDAFLFGVLTAYSVMEICHGAIRLIGRRTNPALILSGSFIIFIFIGSFVLMLPKCTQIPISYCDSLFVSTSAVCITGLTSVDLPSTFTPMGLLVIALMIQIGGLGVITFTSFFALFFSGSPSIYSQLLIKDIVYSKSINNLVPTLLYILLFTLTVEIIGAVAVYMTIPATLGMSFSDKIVFSAFHSLSSFCNAGFSCLPGGMANASLMNSNQSIYIVTSILIFAGAIGFPILVNIKDILARCLHRFFSKKVRRNSGLRQIHLYDLNTKLVLVTTLTILAIGSIGFFILEYNNTLADMSLSKKIVQSVFNSLIPRSAGFTTVNPCAFLPTTMLLIVIQMWIGGSSQSLAGGIKVNTVAAITLNVRAIIRGHMSATAFKRRLAIGSVRRAYAVLALAIASFIFYSFCLLQLEPELHTKDVLFEVTSALFTVGSSLGITDQLCPASKIILSTAMFIGRVGILSILLGFASGSMDRSSHYPTDSIIIS